MTPPPTPPPGPDGRRERGVCHGNAGAYLQHRNLAPFPLPSPAAAGQGDGCPQGGTAEGFPTPVFCPFYPALSPEMLAADAAAVGATPAYYRDVILPQWADCRRDTGGTSRDWQANARRFARTFLTYERAHGRLPALPAAPDTGSPGGGNSLAVMGFPTPSAARTRAPSTDKYTAVAIRGSLDALDLLIHGGA